MNKKDLQIIAHLRQDARMPLTQMSRKTAIPVSTIFDKLKSYEETLIHKHTCLLDFAQLGYTIRANIMLKVERDDREALKDYLTKHQSVNSLYKINNGYDFMVEGVFKHINDMEEFLDAVESKFKINDKKSVFLIKDLKREAFMSDTQLVFE